MLGIDIGDNKIRVVKLKRKRSRITVAGAYSLDFDSSKGSDSIQEIGDGLLKLLAKAGWLKSEAVIAIPHRPCFIKRFDLPEAAKASHYNGKPIVDHIQQQASESLLGSSEEVIFDIWQPENDIRHCKYVIASSAQKGQVNFARRLAEYCNLKLRAIDVRSIASVNSLSIIRQEIEESSYTFIYRDESRIFLAIYDNQGLVSVQSFPGSLTGDSTEDTNSIIRVFNTRKLKQDQPLTPSRIFLSAATAGEVSGENWAREVAAGLCSSMNIEATVVPDNFGLIWSDNIGEEKTAYAPAIGAAMNGLKAKSECFDFLHIKERKPSADEKKNNLTTVLVMLGVMLVFALILWASIVRQTHTAIKRLDDEIANAEPQKEAVYKAQAYWVQCMPYTPASKGGSRLEYLKVLYEITKLMPGTNKAYITNLSVFSDKTVNGYNAKMTIKATEATLITDITESLNKSTMFKDIKQDGARTHDEIDEFYPISFSITFNLNRPGGATPLLREPAKK